jgi:ATP-dependent Zn protease
MTHAMEHCQRPWWKRPPIWFIAIAVVLALVIGIAAEIETTGKAAATSYSVFLDQLEAGNVASVTIQGTEIRGRFKRPMDGAQRDAFSTRAPDFGDPALIPELRKQHVAIDVSSPSPWTSVLARIPWPMLAFLGVVLVAALVRLLRGRKATSGSAGPTMPAHGMMGLVSGLFAKKDEAASPPARDNDEPKVR